jgi:hypothetical protein
MGIAFSAVQLDLGVEFVSGAARAGLVARLGASFFQVESCQNRHSRVGRRIPNDRSQCLKARRLPTIGSCCHTDGSY